MCVCDIAQQKPAKASGCSQKQPSKNTISNNQTLPYFQCLLSSLSADLSILWLKNTVLRTVSDV